MRAKSKLLALALTAATQLAAAAPVALNFEDITASSGDPQGIGMIQLLDRYKTDGVQFTGAAWGVTSLLCGAFSLFIPHDGGCSALLLAGDPRDGSLEGSKSFTLNFADGFITGSSLYYSALSGSGVSITLFDDLDGKGKSTRLAGLAPTDCDVSGARFCNWGLLNLDFSGVARSMVISGVDESLMLDDLKLVKASTGPAPLPEPASVALVLGALGAAGWSRKRKAA
ncbi:MAG: PEP-CTERM sorting domain-containing protein [Burkholderiales bacterium]|jgi:hypothetical protein|nr:PEP-CTERM sorting domain-containing protein [Burkholderiales bacterium]